MEREGEEDVEREGEEDVEREGEEDVEREGEEDVEREGEEDVEREGEEDVEREGEEDVVREMWTLKSKDTHIHTCTRTCSCYLFDWSKHNRHSYLTKRAAIFCNTTIHFQI